MGSHDLQSNTVVRESPHIYADTERQGEVRGIFLGSWLALRKGGFYDLFVKEEFFFLWLHPVRGGGDRAGPQEKVRENLVLRLQFGLCFRRSNNTEGKDHEAFSVHDGSTAAWSYLDLLKLNTVKFYS
jgi:hypothetical protein